MRLFFPSVRPVVPVGIVTNHSTEIKAAGGDKPTQSGTIVGELNRIYGDLRAIDSGKDYACVAQLDQSEIRPQTQRMVVQGDEHPIAKCLVNGPLSNLHEFSAAFSCKPGDAMVRADGDRCEVW